MLRVIDSLQLTAKHKVATPVNWQPGDDVIIAGSVSDDEAKTRYPDGWKAPATVFADRSCIQNRERRRDDFCISGRQRINLRVVDGHRWGRGFPASRCLAHLVRCVGLLASYRRSLEPAVEATRARGRCVSGPQACPNVRERLAIAPHLDQQIGAHAR